MICTYSVQETYGIDMPSIKGGEKVAKGEN
jgi:hypothetical protein